MNSSFILERLGKKFPHNKFDICEAFVYPEESDFLTINRNNYTHEFEVKVSRSDFKADFNKLKHRKFKSLVEGKEMYLSSRGEARNYCTIFGRYVKTDSDKMRFQPWMSSVSFSEVCLHQLPNRFSFIVPEGMVGKNEVPEYSGLYYVKECGKILEVKKSKMLHKKEFNDWQTLASKYYWQLKTGK